MVNIIEDISKITSIPKEYLDKLVKKGMWTITSAVHETQLSNDSLTELDIGLGKLYIYAEQESIKYKFIPSEELEKAVLNTIINEKNTLELTLEKTLANKILQTYKDII